MTVGPAYAKDFDIPTGVADGIASPSPLFGATAFSTPLLRFEEFGLQPMPTGQSSSTSSLPTPSDCQSMPDSKELDDFLKEPLHPLPSMEANDLLPNAWENMIKDCVGSVNQTVLEGRPSGEYFAHQRWDEFFPKVYFQSAQTGARTNQGLRDQYQLHGYSKGEFGSGGLYHLNGTTKGIEVRIHPKMPIQDPKALWTFDGTFPPKLLMARYGEPVLFRHYDALPLDPAANSGFGSQTITTHEHNGHNPAESDGYTAAYFYPGEFYDYHWPMILAGHDSINPFATDPAAGTPDGNGGIIKVPGDWRETMSTHWFHDHMLDFTAPNVYKGNAAMMNYYSAVDRGREPASVLEATGGAKPGYGCHYANPKNVNLCLPSGKSLDWGNRDYDVNLLVADKAWDKNGQLYFNIFNADGFLGDQITVNWQWKPYIEVRARRYRFRILNASVSRYFKIALVNAQGLRVPFHMIANDGNIMEHAVPFPNAQSADLPVQGIAERYDIVIDFKNFKEGDKLYFVNLLEHEGGRGPRQAIPLGDVLSGRYKADGINGDPGVGKFLEFRVKSMPVGQTDLSMNPADYVEGKKKMIPLPTFTTTELQNATHREFELGRSSGTDEKPWTVKTDGGNGFTMDPHRLSAAPDKDSAEIWHIKNGGGSWSHPVHVHFEEGQILKRDGNPPPVWEKWARKDVYRVGDAPDSSDTVDVAIRFREFAGTYMEHCHNTQHEDKAMLLRWDIQHPGQTLALPTPVPGWEGVEYEPTNTTDVPTFKTGINTSDNSGSGSTPGGTNTAPSVTTIANQTATVGQSFGLPVQASDAEGDALTFSLTAAPAGMSINSASGVIAWTPANGQEGSHSVTVQVSDGQQSTTTSFNVTVEPAPVANTAPSVTTIANQTATVGQSFSLPVQASDAEGDALTFSLTAAPVGMSINSASGVIAWTPANGQEGSHSVTVQVSDGQQSTTTSFNVTVEPAPVANTAPVITSTPVTTATLGLTYSYKVTAIDAPGDTLIFSLVSGPAGMSINPSTGQITWRVLQRGSQSVSVRVTDQGGLSATQNFTITVNLPRR
ncbi:putative Ig domain-containing protein [Methylobacter sp. YRD-M1]|uniref:putative Ig domain-containing protein n=1 Tax=Methylobacter sp. YRD-M1 TaxID=2911520 RepID=UPI00227D51C9|nr:putative Ig domain-containing protein [Methylobacter sp. YRD-M1]WAK04123.1 putative Ig domain-containing protein [Methylobacter sp. YRD-M1]